MSLIVYGVQLPRFLFAACCALSVTAVTVVDAQATTRSVGVSLNGGLAQPTGELSEIANAGYRLGVGVWIRPARLERLSFSGDVSYDRFSLKVGSLGAANGVRAKTFVFGGSVSAKYLLAPGVRPIRPYVIGGLGYYNVKDATRSNTQGWLESPGQTKVGVHGGAGLDFRLSGFSTFVEARFQNIFTDDNVNTLRGNMRYVPIVVGFRF